MYDPDVHLTDEPATEAVQRIARERRELFAGPLPDTSDDAPADGAEIPFESEFDEYPHPACPTCHAPAGEVCFSDCTAVERA